MQLQDLKSPKGSRKTKRIVGRGRGSGRGKTSGRGEKGQRSRSGRWKVGGSEGGQMPLIRRLPKVGFRSHRPVLYQVVNVGRLEEFAAGTTINAEMLKKRGFISSINKPFKILGNGELSKSLTVQAPAISKSAKEKIEKAGGKAELIVKNTENKEEK